MSTKVKFDDGCTAALKDVRDDATQTNWAVLTYVTGSKDQVTTKATGSGDADEMKAQLDDASICFCLVRVVDRVDESDTIKFAYIHWVGSDAGAMLKAKQGIQSGSVKDFFTPYHVDLDAEDLDEVSAAIMDEMVGVASGTRSKVLKEVTHFAPRGGQAPAEKVEGAVAPPGAAPKVTAAEPPEPKAPAAKKPAAAKASVPASGSKSPRATIVVQNEADIEAAIANVRDDSHEANWVVVSYVPGGKQPDTLMLHGFGEGGVAEMVSTLSTDAPFYMLSRHIEKIDDTEAVKFAYCTMVGENTPRMLRARLATHKGVANSLFYPYHVSLSFDEPGEITEAVLMDAISSASGTKSHLVNK